MTIHRRKFSLSLFLCFIFFWTIAGTIALQAQISAPGWTPPQGQSIEQTSRRGETPLIELHPEIRIESSAIRRLAPPRSSELQQERKSQRLRIGAVRALDRPIDALAGMTAFNVQGGRLYIARVVSEDALSIRLHFTGASLPPGARLFVYSIENRDHFFGPYESNGPNGDGEFWTPPVVGDGAVIEYFAPDVDKGDPALPFRVAQLTHAFIDERAAIPGVAQQQGPGACNGAVPAAWSEAAKSVARLRFVEPAGEFLCTGALLNTTDNSGKPYILTANHCFSTQAAALSLTATWLYDSGGDNPSAIPGLPSSNGAHLLATGARSDFTLVELRFPVPSGVRFAGWTTEMPGAGAEVASIHHPFGSYKRFSSGNTITAGCPPEVPAQLCNNLLKVRWSAGITEPGSSGGPLFTGNPADPRVAGTLLGGASACNNPSGTDYFGRFDLTFEAIRFYLTGEGCAYELSAPERVVEATGGARGVSVTLREGDHCAWTASADAPWIRITGAANGRGDGQITYEVEPNPAPQTRTGFLIIANQTLAIAQPGSTNNCALSPIAPGQPASGSLSNSDCRSWIDETTYADRYTFQGRAGQEAAIHLRNAQFDGFLTLFNAAGEIIVQNDDALFDGGSRIPGAGNFIVLPADGVYTIEATAVDAGATGNYLLELTTGCVYTARLEQTRFGSVVLDPAFFGHIGGDGQARVQVVSGANCQWRQSANRPWIDVPPASYSGNTSASFSLAPHRGRAPRTATVTAAGLPLKVTQFSACDATRPATLSATNLTLSSFGGNFTLNISVPPDRLCSWEVDRGDQDWLTVEQGFNGIGSGAIMFRCLPNPTLNARTATLRIGGQTLTVRQEPAGGVCQAAPIEAGQTLSGALSTSDCGSPQSPGTFSDHYTFNAVARQQVAVLVTSQDFAPSILLFSPNGDSNGVVSNPPGSTATEVRLPAEGYSDLHLPGKYTIIVTSRDVGRTGAYSIKLIGLGGSGCGYLTSPGYVRIAGQGGSGSVNLTVQNGCPWEAKSNVPWITFPKDQGSGDGAIAFTAAPNPGERRRGIVTIANRFTEVVQDAQCSFLEVTPRKFHITARGFGFSAAINTGAGCNWTVSSQSNWIRILSVTRGDDLNGVTFTADENTGNVRVGSVEIGGRAYEVRQGSGNLATVSSASFAGPIAPGGIASVFGQELATRTEVATTLPLGQSLADSRVTIYDGRGNGRDSLLFFVSPDQINYQVPPDSFPGDGVVQVFNGNGMTSIGRTRIERVAPGLFSANANGQGVAAAVVLRIKADGSQSYEPAAVFDQAQNRFIARPIDPGPATDQLFLILFGTGLRNRSALAAVTATIGGANAEVLFADAQGGLVGLDQLNLRLPRSLAGRGDVEIAVIVDGMATNKVLCNIR